MALKKMWFKGGWAVVEDRAPVHAQVTIRTGQDSDGNDIKQNMGFAVETRCNDEAQADRYIQRRGVTPELLPTPPELEMDAQTEASPFSQAEDDTQEPQNVQRQPQPVPGDASRFGAVGAPTQQVPGPSEPQTEPQNTQEPVPEHDESAAGGQAMDVPPPPRDIGPRPQPVGDAPTE